MLSSFVAALRAPRLARRWDFPEVCQDSAEGLGRVICHLNFPVPGQRYGRVSECSGRVTAEYHFFTKGEGVLEKRPYTDWSRIWAPYLALIVTDRTRMSGRDPH